MENIKEINIETGVETIRELTEEEINFRLVYKTYENELQETITSKATAKAALLAQLGITEEQAKLLLS